MRYYSIGILTPRHVQEGPPGRRRTYAAGSVCWESRLWAVLGDLKAELGPQTGYVAFGAPFGTLGRVARFTRFYFCFFCFLPLAFCPPTGWPP